MGTQGSGTSPLPADLKAGLETHRGDPRSHCIAVVCGEGDIARWARSGGPDGENDRTSWTVQLPSMLYSPQLGQSVSPTFSHSVGGSAAFHLEPFLVLWGFHRTGWVLPTPIAPLGAK